MHVRQNLFLHNIESFDLKRLNLSFSALERKATHNMLPGSCVEGSPWQSPECQELGMIGDGRSRSNEGLILEDLCSCFQQRRFLSSFPKSVVGRSKTVGLPQTNNNNGVMATTTVYGTETVAIDEDATPLILYHYETDTPNPSDNEIPVFQDVFFAILFWVHLLFMVWLGVEVAPTGYEKIDINWTMIEQKIKEGDDVTEEDFTKFEDFLGQATDFLEVYPYRIVVYLVVPCLLISFLLALLATATLIKPFPKPIVYASLIGSVLGTILVLGSFALSTGSLLSILLAGLMLMGVGYYVKIAWRMVPFAAVNLKVALEGIGKNLGVYLVAFLLSQLGFVWNIFWVYILIGVSALKDTECLNDHPEATLDDDTCSPPVLVVAGFLLSLYWTSTVIMNTIQVTVSGYVQRF